MRVAEPAQDGEGLDRARPADRRAGRRGTANRASRGARPPPSGRRKARSPASARSPSPRRGRRAEPGVTSAQSVHGRSRLSEDFRFASPIARRGASVYTPPTLERLAARDLRRWALSSAVEHYLDMVGVRGSIPLAPTIPGPQLRLIFAPVFGESANRPLARLAPPDRRIASLSLRTTAFTDAKRSKAGRALLSIVVGLALLAGALASGGRGGCAGRDQGQARRLGDALRDPARRRP